MKRTIALSLLLVLLTTSLKAQNVPLPVQNFIGNYVYSKTTDKQFRSLGKTPTFAEQISIMIIRFSLYTNGKQRGVFTYTFNDINGNPVTHSLNYFGGYENGWFHFADASDANYGGLYAPQYHSSIHVILHKNLQVFYFTWDGKTWYEYDRTD